MKIVHICLSGSYNIDWSYQDNLIPKYHKKFGYDVTVITSIFTNSTRHAGYEKVSEGTYYSKDGVKVIRIPFKRLLLNQISERLRIYEGLFEKLDMENPDIIFIHGCQFYDIRIVVKYLKNNKNIRVFVDNHADFSNSARNFISKSILHKLIWRRCAVLISPFAEKFYGVLPARVNFLNEMYNIPKDKIDLLVMGADDDEINKSAKSNLFKQYRKKYGIRENDILLVTGGKIDYDKKQTLLLMQAVKNINVPNLKLIVFGSVIDDLKVEVESLSDGEKIQYVGWIQSQESYSFFGMADLVVFPGRHSVFWEQVVGQGIPLLVRWWEGTNHIDIGGNVKYLYEDSESEIRSVIEEILNDSLTLNEMKIAAEGDARKQFLYSEISRLSIK
ncbi:glycosyltransferase family 4 protein [Aerococcus viridans]|uniref:glycosyltransferase family 4 protein n=1 Tax=Aerococcus viridans TaxID=1377 RepID=UPI003B220E61